LVNAAMGALRPADIAAISAPPSSEPASPADLARLRSAIEWLMENGRIVIRGDDQFAPGEAEAQATVNEVFDQAILRRTADARDAGTSPERQS
jgi:hypothetical protein